MSLIGARPNLNKGQEIHIHEYHKYYEKIIFAMPRNFKNWNSSNACAHLQEKFQVVNVIHLMFLATHICLLNQIWIAVGNGAKLYQKF